MTGSFIVGLCVGWGFFLYTTVYRYQNLSRKINETRIERIKRVLTKVAWLRVIGLTILSGVATFVLWHGLEDILQVVL